jgi:hypothetical protein
MLLDPVLWVFVLAAALLVVAVVGVVIATRRARQGEPLELPGLVPADQSSDFSRLHELRTEVKRLGDECDRLVAERDEMEAVLNRLAVLLERADRAVQGAPTSRLTR